MKSFELKCQCRACVKQLKHTIPEQGELSQLFKLMQKPLLRTALWSITHRRLLKDAQQSNVVQNTLKQKQRAGAESTIIWRSSEDKSIYLDQIKPRAGKVRKLKLPVCLTVSHYFALKHIKEATEMLADYKKASSFENYNKLLVVKVNNLHVQ